MNSRRQLVASISALWLACCQLIALLPADDHSIASSLAQKENDDGWMVTAGPNGRIMTMELTLYAAAEPRPALKYQLIPDEYDRLEGNAAVYYLRALGFLERDAARRELERFHEEQLQRARESGVELTQVPPYIWQSTPPDELPRDEVKKYLELTAFQTHLLREAARRDRFDMERRFKTLDNPYNYLLPDIQVMRQLARTQRIRCRLAIAEGRIEDALEILGQQFALARHLGQDEFLVSGLMGMAVIGVAWQDALYLVQHPDTPNLYWALAALPKPIVSIRRSLANERQFPYAQFKSLREIDSIPRPAAYWQEFLDRLADELQRVDFELLGMVPKDQPKLTRAALAAYVADAYPGARDFLLTELKMTAKQIDALPTAQVVLLACVRFYDQWRDELLKWTYLPLARCRSNSNYRDMETRYKKATARFGKCTAPTEAFLPVIRHVAVSAARMDHDLAMLQTVEAIRMYAAAHNNTLPRSLDDLPVPAPITEYTGKPIAYELQGDHATLIGSSFPGIQRRLILRIAERK